MANQLMILWVAWWAGATLLTLGLIVLNARRRKRIIRSGDEATRMALPTWRDDLLWGALAVVGGGVGTGVLLLLLRDGHTARGVLASAIFGMIMLLGLLMLLKNGLAPTDVVRLEAQEPLGTPAHDTAEAEPVEWLHYRKAPTDF